MRLMPFTATSPIPALITTTIEIPTTDFFVTFMMCFHFIERDPGSHGLEFGSLVYMESAGPPVDRNLKSPFE